VSNNLSKDDKRLALVPRRCVSPRTRAMVWFLYTRYWTLCVLDRASCWYLNKGRPTWWHLLYYVNLLLNMFRMLIYPSSGACDYLVRYCVGCIVLTWGANPATLHQHTSSQHNTAYTITHQVVASLKMDVLISETCWAVNWHNKASVIKLVYLYSNDIEPLGFVKDSEFHG